MSKATGGPTKAQVKAVRKVLYDPDRTRALTNHMKSIAVLMCYDALSPPDSAPIWSLPATGEPGAGVKESIQRCRKIARSMGKVTDQLDDVKIPKSDRAQLKTMVKEQAAAWDLRADLWGSPDKPDARKGAKRINGHLRDSAEAAKKVKDYLKVAE